MLELVIDSAEVADSEPREIKAEGGADSDGNRITRTVTVNRTIHVSYAYPFYGGGFESLDWLDASILDGAGPRGTVKASCRAAGPPRRGARQCPVSLETPNGDPRFDFRYNIFIEHTAVIHLALDGAQEAAPSAPNPPEEASSEPGAPLEPDIGPEPGMGRTGLPLEPRNRLHQASPPRRRFPEMTPAADSPAGTKTGRLPCR